MKTDVTWSVFTKPWPMHTAHQLADVVGSLGFDGVELPVRETSFITPATAADKLPQYVAELRERGLETVSVAADLSESIFAACQSAAVPLIRIMIPVADNDYAESFRNAQKNLRRAAQWMQEYGVGVAVQPHRGPYITSTLGVLGLLAELPGNGFSIAWDAAHDALAGDDPVTTLSLARDFLSIANLKNAIYIHDGTSPDAEQGTRWKPWFVPGREGLSNWSRVLHQLRAMDFNGPICLTGQYSPTDTPLEQLLSEDLQYARDIWASTKPA